MIEIKEITDIDLLMAMRMEVIDCVFSQPSPQLMEQLALANRRYYERHLPDGSHVACFAYDDGALCGSGAICLYDEMPSPDNFSGCCAYIMNVYVRPAFRNRGIATAIVGCLVEKAKALGAGKIYLEATDMASSLYRNMGFHEMANMMKYEDNDNRLPEN